MKKFFIPILLAGAMCVTFASCDDSNDNINEGGITITESTNPQTLTGERVDRTAWQAAFGEEENYTVKTVVTADIMQNGDTMSENVTLIYRLTADKHFLSLNMKEGNKTSFEAEAYMELDGDTVTMWQRAKESGTWSDWDSETYSKEDLGEFFGLSSDLTFLKGNYANFAYIEADKGYTATASGLAEMQDALDEFARSIIGMIGGDSTQLKLDKFVLKINSGKVGACLVDLTIAEAAQTPDQQDSRESETSDEGTPEEAPEVPESPEDPEEPVPEQPMSGNVKLTQIFYNYGKTEVTRPEGITQGPSEDDKEEPSTTPEDTTDPEQRLIK